MFELNNQTEISVEQESTKNEEINNFQTDDEKSKEQLVLNNKLITLLLLNKGDDIISQFIETSGVDINYFNNEYNPLFQVIKTYQSNEKTLLKFVKLLNDFYVNYNIVWRDGNIPLFEFLKMESNTCLKLLTLAKESGANMYQLDKKKKNLLMYALELRANFKIVKYLFSLNYNLSNQDIDGNTVYIYATVYYNINSYNKVLPFLLKNFIYSNDVIIKLILMGKYKQPASKQNIVSIIKSNNELINIKNNEGDNALFIAIRSYRQSKILTYLIQLGSRIDEVDKNGSSPLIIAAENRNYKAFHYLMHFHPDLNYKNNNNDTALTMAVKSNDVNMVKLLLNFCEIKESDKINENKKKFFNISFRSKIFDDTNIENVEDTDVAGFDNLKNLKINEQNNEGDTALSLAIQRKNKEMVYNLLICGADPLITNNKKETALINAVQANNENIVDLVLNVQDDVNEIEENHDTPIIIAVRNGNDIIVSKLLKKNADITIRDKDFNTPLMIAVRKKENISIVSNLLNRPNNTLHYRDSNGKTAFLLSIESNCLDITKLLIKSGALMSDADSKKNNALMLACKYSNTHIANYLIESKIFDLNVQNENLNTALIKACKKNTNLNIVKTLVNNSADLEIKNKLGNTALIVACLNSNAAIIKCLLNSGANLECNNNEGITPVIASCQNNNVGIAKTLICEYKANVNYDDTLTKEKMDECFIDSVEQGHHDIVKLLLNNNYKIDISDRNNNFFKLLSALITATNNSQYKIIEEILSNPYFEEILEEFRQSKVLITACQNIKKKTIDLLLKYNVNVNVKDDHNNTALIVSSQHAYLYNSVKEFVNRNADLNVINDEGTSALLNSCKDSDVRIFKFLVNKGASIYITDHYGNNALMHACSYNEPNKIKYLIKKGININAQNNDGDTALMQCVKAGNVNIVKYLIKHNANVNVLNNKNQNALVVAFLTSYGQEVVDYKNLSIIKILISKKTDPNVPIDETGNSILMFLIMKNDVSMIKYISKVYSKKLDYNHKNHLGHTAFTYALKYNNSEIIDLLISTKKINIFEEDDYGNDMIMYSTCNLSPEYFRKFTKKVHGNLINKCNHNRESYLIMAAKVNNEKVIDMLLDKGADVDHQEAQGNTALHYASRQGNIVTIEKLIKRKASLEIQNYKRETPLMIACRFKQKESIKVLLENGASSLFVDNIIYSEKKSFDFRNDQDSYIDMMIDYYAGNSESVPNNYMSTVTLLQRMRKFYEPAIFKDRFEGVEDHIMDGIEEFFEFCIDTLVGKN